ncbi:Adenylyl cyclase class-3/4/guanylyl cyclase [Trypanosoma melophagium]|uniref:Adenylyl cyclase class-3/4/guanylyl cyclase n=1 Tax=Trypanosoma melophagium TaxID=715481 RepID=UPI00351A6B58|nr:Adenylyl cyclase class-3/4/guanylyl cyclase [Trypanosoma melophagium]
MRCFFLNGLRGDYCLAVEMFFVLLLLALCVAADGNLKEIKILNLFYSTGGREHSHITAINSGFEAALLSQDYTVGNFLKLKVLTIAKEDWSSNLSDVIEKSLVRYGDIFVLIGPLKGIELASARPALHSKNLVTIAPFSGSSSERYWDKQVYFTRSDWATELLALINYAVGHLRMRRLGFMYLKKSGFGELEYAETTTRLSELGYSLSGVFTLPFEKDYSKSQDEFDTAFEGFAKTRPQVIIVFGRPSLTTTQFLIKVRGDYRINKSYLLGPGVLQNTLIDGCKKAEKLHQKNKCQPRQIVTTGTNPLPSDTRFKAIERFQKEMKVYREKNGLLRSKPLLNSEENDELMVTGWIAGKVLLQAISNPEWIKDKTSFATSLFNQRRYVIDDIIIGDYGGECTDIFESQGAMCYCNQGGRTVYMKRFTDGFQAEVIEEGTLRIPFTECYSLNFRIAAPLIAVTIDWNDSPHTSRNFEELKLGLLNAIKRSSNSLDSHHVTIHRLNSNPTDGRLVLLKEIEDKNTHAVAGIVTEAMLDVPNVTFIDPLFLQPRLNKFRRHVIHLSPTVEQELLVLAFYLGNTTGATAAAVIRCDEAAAVEDVLRRSLVTFGGSLRSAALLAGGDSLAGRLPSSGAVFVVGLADGDAALIAGHLTKHSGVRVFVLFSELSLRYAEFTAAFDGSGSADRLVFATSLPHWADVKTESETVRKYHAAVTDETDRTPLSLRAFANVRLLQTVLSRMDTVNADTLSGFFYQNIAISAEDMLYGSFTDGSECAAQGIVDAAKCIVNYGATRISVWSMSRALNPTVSELFPPVTPSMEYVEPPKGGLTLQQLIGVIVGCVAGVLLLVGLILFLLLRRRSARDNANAPKEPTDPVTLVFTDIESSTALWAACPEIMPDAVATHHRLIRALIAKYRCYEVKTIGDSFMIASRSVFAAVQLVRELQQSFLHHDWGTGAIDDAYHEFEEGKAAEDDEYVPPTARLDAAVYRQYWNGLRVRAAVHTGLADIRHDEVTKGYDYYGSTSNTAARTESVANGGQVLLTRAAYMALSTAEREQVDVTALGPVALRGVPKPVEMYQLDAVPGRTFAALRLGREEGLEDVEDTFDTTDSSYECNSAAYDTTVSFILSLFSAYNPRQRAGVLQSLCARWQLRVGARGDMPYEEHCHQMVRRLAVRLNRLFGCQASVTSFVGALHSDNTDNAVQPFYCSSMAAHPGVPPTFSSNLPSSQSSDRSFASPSMPTEQLECTIAHQSVIVPASSSAGRGAHVSSVSSESQLQEPTSLQLVRMPNSDDEAEVLSM